MDQDLIDLIAKKDGERFKIRQESIPETVKKNTELFSKILTESLELELLIEFASLQTKEPFPRIDVNIIRPLFEYTHNAKQWIKDNYGELEPKKEIKVELTSGPIFIDEKELTWLGEPIPKEYKIVNVDDLCDGTIEPSLDQPMIVCVNESKTEIAVLIQLFIEDGGKITAFSLKHENDKIVKYFINKKEQNNA